MSQKGGVDMRIEAYTQVQQVYNTRKPGKAQAASNVSFSDQLELSTVGKDMQIAKQAVKNSPDIRESLTSKIKAQMESGTYQVSAEAFAEKMISRMSAI